jgi:hypothetical protein
LGEVMKGEKKAWVSLQNCFGKWWRKAELDSSLFCTNKLMMYKFDKFALRN